MFFKFLIWINFIYFSFLKLKRFSGFNPWNFFLKISPFIFKIIHRIGVWYKVKFFHYSLVSIRLTIIIQEKNWWRTSIHHTSNSHLIIHSTPLGCDREKWKASEERIHLSMSQAIIAKMIRRKWIGDNWFFSFAHWNSFDKRKLSWRRDGIFSFFYVMRDT